MPRANAHVHAIRCITDTRLPPFVYILYKCRPARLYNTHSFIHSALQRTRRSNRSQQLQRSLSLSALKRLSHPVGGRLVLRASRQQLTTLLPHVVLLLHGRQLLVLGEAQGERHAEEESRGGDNPGGLAAEAEGGPGGGGHGVDLARDPAAGCGGDDVAEGVEAFCEGFFCRVVVGFVGDLRV